MTVFEIIREYLTANGYDGLYDDDDEDGCGCRLDDLAPCLGTCGGNDITGCKAGCVNHDGVMAWKKVYQKECDAVPHVTVHAEPTTETGRALACPVNYMIVPIDGQLGKRVRITVEEEVREHGDPGLVGPKQADTPTTMTPEEVRAMTDEELRGAAWEKMGGCWGEDAPDYPRLITEAFVLAASKEGGDAK